MPLGLPNVTRKASTIKELLEGKEFDFPKGYSLRSSGKRLTREGEQTELGFK